MRHIVGFRAAGAAKLLPFGPRHGTDAARRPSNGAGCAVSWPFTAVIWGAVGPYCDRLSTPSTAVDTNLIILIICGARPAPRRRPRPRGLAPLSPPAARAGGPTSGSEPVVPLARGADGRAREGARGGGRAGGGGEPPLAVSSGRSRARSTWTRCSPARSRPGRGSKGWTPPWYASRAPRGSPTIAAHGLSADGAEAISGPPDGSRARAIEVTYRYGPPEDGDPAGPDPRRPRRAARRTTAPGSAFSRSTRASRAPALRRRGRPRARGADTTAPTLPIENARRFREARQLADLDALTGLHNRRYFHETLGRDVPALPPVQPPARADRLRHRRLQGSERPRRHLAGDAVLAEAAERVREVIRTADIPCRVGGDEFAVILPEKRDRAGGASLRAPAGGRSPAGRSARPGGSTSPAGVAELKAGRRLDHASSSGPTRRSTAPRKPGKTRA